MNKALTHALDFLQLNIALMAVILALSSAAHATTWDRPHADAYTLPVNTLTEGSQFTLVFVGDPPASLSSADVESAMKHATKVWSAVSCAQAEVAFGGRRLSLDDVAPGETPIFFVDPSEQPCFPEQEGLIGWTSYSCEGLEQTSVLLNARDYDWSASPAPDTNVNGLKSVDTKSVITHEVGHVLGLTHTQNDRLATMVGTYLLDGGQTSLAADDKFNLCALFPGGQSECDMDADCGSGLQTCVSADGLRVCEEERGRTGDYCSVAYDICPTACLLTSSETLTGYCVASCDNGCTEGTTCGDSGFCELDAVDPDEAGCSHMRTASDSLIPFFLLGLFTWQRRRVGQALR